MGRKRRSTEFKNRSQVIDIDEARKQRLEKRRQERKREEAKLKRAAEAKSRSNMAIRKRRMRHRLMIGIIVVCVLGAIVFSVLNIISLKSEQHQMKEQQEALKKEKQELEKELEKINDIQNLEDQARNQLRLIKPGETIYIFPEEVTEGNGKSEN